MSDNGEGLRAEVVRMICASPSRKISITQVGCMMPSDRDIWVENVIKDAEILVSYIENGIEAGAGSE